MINDLLFISLAPVLVIALYVYSRDRYEKEPYSVLIKALFTGIFIALPAVIIERFLDLFSGDLEGLKNAAYSAFAVAALTEEGLKFLAFRIFLWKDKNFNEKFDGIVYAVYISLGFAAVENVLYVFSGGYSVGLVRAITAVPAHALFGIVMGFYFGVARFSDRLRKYYILMAFILPFLFHGFYDFMLMGKTPFLLMAFIPVVIYFWVTGFRKMNKLSEASVFRPSAKNQGDSGSVGV
jgi:RsiW-degrading membrane proteinase PrsW (M82 family)